MRFLGIFRISAGLKSTGQSKASGKTNKRFLPQSVEDSFFVGSSSFNEFSLNEITEKVALWHLVKITAIFYL